MDDWLSGRHSMVWALHGIGGIGKTTVARALAARAQAAGRVPVWIDGQSVEPSPRAVWNELAESLGLLSPEPAEVLRAIAAIAPGVLLVFDTFERCRQLDGWMRRSFVPALPPTARVLIVGRDSPVPQWALLDSPHALHASTDLPGLDADAARQLLLSLGLGEHQSTPVLGFARGHPLALRLAARLLAGQPDRRLQMPTVQPVLDALVQTLHSEVDDPAVRQALHRASVVRRVTISLLRALVPGADAHALFDALAGLPMCSVAFDGLLIHDAARAALAAHFKAIDPAGYRDARRAAWLALRDESLGAGSSELWRYTADMLYLVEAPTVRETFFPSSSEVVAVEAAAARDEGAVMQIAAQQLSAEELARLRHWWRAAPAAFRVTRDANDQVSGFSCFAERAQVPAALLSADPLSAAWMRHLDDDPVDPDECVLLLRMKLSAAHGGEAAATEAALMLDLKRAYVELRPRLRRLYCATRDASLFTDFARNVGFRRLPECDVAVDGHAGCSLLLDFGPKSVDGWLSQLVAVSLAEPQQPAVVLDEAARELMVDGQRVGLTTLEFEVMGYLAARNGQAVKRGDLLDDVWGVRYEGGSNVIDVVIRALRRKLGVRAGCIETVPRFGYRFRQP
ncbi:MAG TPA: winged helix-turn-helix domain-containing protein [Albitalea sp.]